VELALVPNPLSGIAHSVPSRPSTAAEKPGITWPAKGPVRPFAGVARAPEGGPGWSASADRVARATRVGSTTLPGVSGRPGDVAATPVAGTERTVVVATATTALQVRARRIREEVGMHGTLAVHGVVRTPPRGSGGERPVNHVGQGRRLDRAACLGVRLATA
jgi:hypothetical protein